MSTNKKTSTQSIQFALLFPSPIRSCNTGVIVEHQRIKKPLSQLFLVFLCSPWREQNKKNPPECVWGFVVPKTGVEPV